MEELFALHKSQLRERAARFRELARGATACDVADVLMALARDYEADARRLGRGTSMASQTSPISAN